MKPNIALVGFGYWGKNLARVFSELGQLSVICESDSKRSEIAKNKYPDVRHVRGFEDVLKDNSIKAVVISTPAETHYSLVKEALSSQKDVFVEKPLALTVGQGAELSSLAQRNKRILMVGHLLEYHPAIIKLKEIIDKGELGKIQYIYSNRLNLGKIRREENILWSFAPHDISVMLLLLNEMPLSVSAHGGNYLDSNIADVTVSNLNFASSVKGHIFVSWLHPYKEQKLIIVGDKQMAVFDDVAEKDKLSLYNHKIDWIDRVPVPKKENAQTVEFDPAEPLLLECRHFIDCIDKRHNPKTDAKNGLRVLEVLDACESSLKNNGAVIQLNHAGYFAHHTSVIDEPCSIGEGTKIWHYSHVMKEAKIGKRCSIGQNVSIASRAVIGNNVKIQNNVSVYDFVTLEDDVFCGPSCVFTNVINPRSHVCRKDEYKHTLIKKGATIGANATVVCGVTVGEYAFIGAGAVVTKDLPAHSLVYGNPAAIKGWMCECGVKLDFGKSDKAICSRCGCSFIKYQGAIKKSV